MFIIKFKILDKIILLFKTIKYNNSILISEFYNIFKKYEKKIFIKNKSNF